MGLQKNQTPQKTEIGRFPRWKALGLRKRPQPVTEKSGSRCGDR